MEIGRHGDQKFRRSVVWEVWRSAVLEIWSLGDLEFGRHGDQEFRRS